MMVFITIVYINIRWTNALNWKKICFRTSLSEYVLRLKYEFFGAEHMSDLSVVLLFTKFYRRITPTNTPPPPPPPTHTHPHPHTNTHTHTPPHPHIHTPTHQNPHPHPHSHTHPYTPTPIHTPPHTRNYFSGTPPLLNLIKKCKQHKHFMKHMHSNEVTNTISL